MAEERTEMTNLSGGDTSPREGAGQDDPETIKADIARTRAEMSQTIDEISDRLNPANVMHQATETVRDATVRRVRMMMDNPWPVALIGAGVAWMVYDRTRRGGDYDPDYTSDYVGRAEGSAFDDVTDWDEDDLGRDPESVPVASRLRGAGRRTIDAVSSAGSRVRTGWTTVRSRTSTGFDHMMRDNPLAVGAAALAIGATIGLLVPRTQQENRLMGDARDSLVEMAQDAARRVGERVQETVADSTDVET